MRKEFKRGRIEAIITGWGLGRALYEQRNIIRGAKKL